MGILKRFLLVVMLWPLLFTVAFAENSTARFELKGVLISAKGRDALINGEFAREGDRVGGATILSIGEKSVALQIGTQEYTVLVGSSTIAHRRAVPERRMAAQQRPVADGRQAYTVKRGDTLSAIAERYAGNGISLNQVIVALYEANPQAFDGNINRMRAGAVLQVPARDLIQAQSVAAATTEVLRQSRFSRQIVRRHVKVPERREFGPVKAGDSLSRIAASLRPDGVTLNQMMMALFETNPHAFDGNINRLRRGMILRVPHTNDIRRWTRATANAEVQRHARLWRIAAEPITVASI